MPYIDTNQTVLTIINKVFNRLGLSDVTDLAQNKLAITAVGLLNDVIEEIGAYGKGDWPQLYVETTVAMVSGQSDYKLNFDLKTLAEVAVSGHAQALYYETLENIRRLRRTNGLGMPRFYAITHVSGLAPTIRVHPRPNTTNTHFNVAYYSKPVIIRTTAADESIVPPFPSILVTQGLYAAMLLEESGSQPTQESLAATTLFNNMKREYYNQYNNDTGNDVYFVPIQR